jgi:hypothetical protein
MRKTVSVTCPCCAAALEVDIEAGVVVGHTPPPSNKEKIDFDRRLQELEEQKARASDRMAEALRKEKSKDRLMEDRFRKLMDDAKKNDDGKKHIRDIDLD